MKKQKVISQMKRQDKTSEKQLNEAEISNLPEKEVRIVMVKMIQDLSKRMEKMQAVFTKDLEELKNKQAEVKNALERINNRKTEVEEWISDLEDKMVKIAATEQNAERKE